MFKRILAATALLTATPTILSFACDPPPGGRCVMLPSSARTSEKVYALPGLGNVGRVADGVFRGAQPADAGYATLKRMGIRTVVNMRTTESERKKVETAGMTSVEIPIAMNDPKLREKVDRVVAAMADPANQPVYIHCRHGQDRTGIVVAAYRMKVQGWRLPEAEAEMQSFGFNDVWINFKRFIRDYGAAIMKARTTASLKVNPSGNQRENRSRA